MNRDGAGTGRGPDEGAGPGGQAGLLPDVQGLRAVAVALVVVFHLWPAALPGGFIGVDLFFVVSGYLIFGILLRSVERTGSVQPLVFLGRRIRRIVPAVALVLAVVGMASPFLPTAEWGALAEEIPASAFFYENWLLAAREVGYWTRGDATMLQHFWSLAVEFQFYLAAPIAVGLAAMLVRPDRRPGAILAVLATIAVLSFALGVAETAARPERAYYATEGRVWEFALGGLLVVSGLRQRLSRRWAEGAAIIGAALVLGSALLIDGAMPFPGVVALLPCVGAVLLVAGGARSSIGRLLSMRWPVAVGGLSYAIYLWHWPVIIAWPGNIALQDMSLLSGALIAAIAVGLAALTKLLVEDPIRHARPLRNIPVLAVVAGLVLSGVAAATALIPARAVERAAAASALAANRTLYPGALALTDGAVVPAVAGFLPRPAVAGRDWPEPYLDECQADAGNPRFRTCVYGVLDSAFDIVLVGDSHATQFALPLRLAAEQRGWRYTHMTMGSCAFIDATVDREGRAFDACGAWNEAAMAELARLGPEVVLVAQSADYGVDGRSVADSTALVRDGLLRRWAAVAALGSRVIAIRDTPHVGVSSADCLADPVARCNAPREDVLPAVDPILQAAGLASDVALIDLTDAICGPERCPPVVGNLLVWLDSNHLTNSYAGTMADTLGAALAAAIAATE